MKSCWYPINSRLHWLQVWSVCCAENSGDKRPLPHRPACSLVTIPTELPLGSLSRDLRKIVRKHNQGSGSTEPKKYSIISKTNCCRKIRVLPRRHSSTVRKGSWVSNTADKGVPPDTDLIYDVIDYETRDNPQIDTSPNTLSVSHERPRASDQCE